MNTATDNEELMEKLAKILRLANDKEGRKINLRQTNASNNSQSQQLTQ